MGNPIVQNRVLSATYVLPDGSEMTGLELVSLKRISLERMARELRTHSIATIIATEYGKRTYYDENWDRITIAQMVKRSGWSVEEAMGPADEVPERFAHLPIPTKPAVRACDMPKRGRPRSASAAATPQLAIDTTFEPLNLLDLDWDQRFLALAKFWSGNSKDPSTKVGAVIVGQDKREVCIGYNGFPPGIKDDHRLHNRDMKYPIVVHAERNALDNARFDVRGATLYATLAPCCGCAASIISKGIKRVVCPEPDLNDPVVQRNGIETAHLLLKEAGVVISWVAVPA
jgi:dCMP deaminase